MARRDATELGLIRAILEADVEDDEPRLVYADYLQERGDPRGELIAVQCREARASGDDFADRARNLFDAEEPRWLGVWRNETAKWRFRRGFLDHLVVRVDTFVMLSELLFEDDPVPDELVHLGSLELQEQPLPFDAMHSWNLQTALAPPARLAAAERFAAPLIAILERLRLRSLSLRIPISEGFARMLAASSALAHLTTLRITGVPRDRNVVAILLGGARLDRLHTLELPNCGLVDDEIAGLVAEPRYAQIRRLDLTSLEPPRNLLSLANLVAVIDAGRGLTALELRGNPSYYPGHVHPWLDDDVLVALARSRPPLVELGLGGMSLTSGALQALCKLRTLERLDLRSTPIDDDALDSLLALPNLTTLNVAHTAITEVGVERILRDAPPSLRELTLTARYFAALLIEQLNARFKLHRWR